MLPTNSSLQISLIYSLCVSSFFLCLQASANFKVTNTADILPTVLFWSTPLFLCRQEQLTKRIHSKFVDASFFCCCSKAIMSRDAIFNSDRTHLALIFFCQEHLISYLWATFLPPLSLYKRSYLVGHRIQVLLYSYSSELGHFYI